VSTATRPPVRERPPSAPRSSRRPPRGRGGGPGALRFGLPVLGGALAFGLLIGYVAHGGGKTTTVTSVHTVTAKAAATTPAGGTAAGAEARGRIVLAVLNGSSETGLAKRTADEARTLGYRSVTEGNAPSPASASKVYFRAGSAPEGRQVAQDLGLPAPTRLPLDGDLDQAVPVDAQVIAVLGATGAGDATAGAAATGADATSTAPLDEGASTAPLVDETSTAPSAGETP
jgi:hypothetical protein